MSFNDFVRKHNIKNKATSNIKIQQVLCSIGLNNIGIYLRDGPFESDIGIVSLHPSKMTHWVCNKNGNYFGSYGCVCPKKLSKIIIKRIGYCLYSEYEIQKKIVFVRVFVYIYFFLTKVLGIDLKSAVLNLYYQKFSWINYFYNYMIIFIIIHIWIYVIFLYWSITNKLNFSYKYKNNYIKYSYLNRCIYTKLKIINGNEKNNNW